MTKTSKRPNLSELFNVRVIQRNLVYVIGLAPEISYENELTRDEYFGQYGTITKIIVNKDKPFNPKSQNGPTYSAYITYLCVDQFDESNLLKNIWAVNAILISTLIKSWSSTPSLPVELQDFI